jgi:metallo-beta-lactamase family protein
MKITFAGAARAVTGSCHKVECGEKTILLDCGLHQGHREEADRLNRTFPFAPEAVDHVLLSHAHIDHSGNLPTLVRNGFKGPIVTTHATVDLLRVMLRDSAHIQKKDIEYVNKKRKRKGLPPKDILYSEADVEDTLALLEGVGYHERIVLGNGLTVQFEDAGHMLGSALIRLNDGATALTFTGDLGRKGLPILRDPDQVEETDYLITESTYAGRFHESARETEEELGEITTECLERKGKIIVPAFSVGRTQSLVYSLHSLFNDKKIPGFPIFVDSPLSVNATEVFRDHPECYDEETREMLRTDGDPFGFGRLKYVKDREESIALNSVDYPCMIISASGMCEAGRILHHLKNSIGDSKNTVLIVGFQAEGTLGRRLVEKEKVVKIFGEEHRRECRVEVLNGYSAHADDRELHEYIDNIKIAKGIFCVHGEGRSIIEFGRSLAGMKRCPVRVPVSGESFELD